PFFPFLYSATLSANFSKTSSTIGINAEWSDSCNRFSSVATRIGSTRGCSISLEKTGPDAEEKLNIPDSTSSISDRNVFGASGNSSISLFCALSQDRTGPSIQLADDLYNLFAETSSW